MEQTTRKIISNEMSIFKGNPTSLSGFPLRMALLNLTELNMTGMIIGKSKMGRSTSRSFVFRAIAEKSVPTETKPIVPRRITSKSGTALPNKL